MQSTPCGRSSGADALTHPAIRRRRAEQRARLELAASWARRLAQRLEVTAAVVFGSSLRGDFNKWSDIDVLVISPRLPARARDRLELLMADTPPGVQPIGWTPEEYDRRLAKGDPIARECEESGHVVWGALTTA